MRYRLLAVAFMGFAASGQTAQSDYHLKEVYSCKLRHLKVSEEDFREPITFEDADYLYYTHNGRHPGDIRIWQVSKKSDRTRSITCQTGDPDIQPGAFMMAKGYLYLVGYSSAGQVLLKCRKRSNSLFETSVSRQVNFVPNNRNLILLKDSFIVINSFYYPDLSIPNTNNLNITVYDPDLNPVKECSVNTGLTAISSIDPQHYFYVRHDSLYFLSPSDGRIHVFMQDTLRERHQLRMNDLKLLSKESIDTLRHYAIRTDVMSTYWKLNDYLDDSGVSYFFFIDPIAPEIYLLGVRDISHARWMLLNRNFQEIHAVNLIMEIARLNQNDYFSYYFTHLQTRDGFSSIRIRKGRINRFRRYFDYTHYTSAW